MKLGGDMMIYYNDIGDMRDIVVLSPRTQYAQKMSISSLQSAHSSQPWIF